MIRPTSFADRVAAQNLFTKPKFQWGRFIMAWSKKARNRLRLIASRLDRWATAIRRYEKAVTPRRKPGDWKQP